MGEKRMLKSIQTKIVIAFGIIGFIVILALGTTYIYTLENINNQITYNIKTEEMANIITNQIYQTKIMICVYLIGFIILMIIMAVFVSKVIISPISSLIKSAEKVTKGEKIKFLSDGKKEMK